MSVFYLTSCSTVETPAIKTANTSYNGATQITHTIKPGETLWQISKMYNIDINDLIERNKIEDCTAVEVGSSVTIPVSSSNTAIAQKTAKTLDHTDFMWPVHGTICEYFKEKTGGVSNKGIDIVLNSNENIVASSEGKVVFIGDIPGYGKTLIINHADNLATIYCGSSDIIVKKGQKVTQGTVIAKSGVSPRKNQPGLHFEIRKQHKPQNPLFYLN